MGNFKEEFKNVSQEVYSATNGQVKLPGYSENSTNIRQGICEAAYNLGTKGYRDTENNAIYDVEKRIERVGAVTSLLTAGYAEAKAQNAYNSIDFNSANMQQTLNQIGYGTQHTNNISNIISTGSFYDNNGNRLHINTNDVLGNRTIMNQLQTTGSFDASLLTTAPRLSPTGQNYGLQSEAAKMSLTMAKNQQAIMGNRIEIASYIAPNGKQVSISQASLQREMNAATKEQDRRNRILNASSKADKKDALLEIRKGQINYLNNLGGPFKGLNSSNATPTKIKEIERSLGKEKNDLLKQKEKLLAKGKNINSPEIKKIDSLLQKNISNSNELNKFKQLGGKVDQQGLRNEANKRQYGKRIIAQNLAGQDAMQGYKYWERSAKLTKNAVTLGYRAATSVGLRAARGVSNVGKYSALGVNKTLRAAGIDNSITRGSAKIANIADTTAKKSKDLRLDMKEKSRMTAKERKALNREQRKDRRNEKRVRKGEKLDSKINSLNGKNKLSPKEQRQLNRLNSKKNKRRTRSDRLSKVKGKFGWVGNGKRKLIQLRKNISNSKLMKLLKMPFKIVDFAKMLIDKLKKMIFMKVILPIVAGILSFLVVFTLPILMPAIITTFFASEMVDKAVDALLPTDNVAQLNSINYIQLIVNETTGSLSQSYQDTAKRDAESYYLSTTDKTDRENDKYDWQRGVNGGELGKLTASEDGREVSSLNANLLPIVSMMHYRYNDDIGFDEYYTAKGGVWVQYVLSHRVQGYNSRIEEDCADDSIYETPLKKEDWNKGTKVLSRPKESCTNVYVHGYTKEFNQTINKLRGNMLNFLDKAIGALNEAAGEDVLPVLGLQEQGVWVQTLPSDSKGTCKKYISVQYGTTTADLWTAADNQPTNGRVSGNFTNASSSGCPEPETHTHTLACYTNNCSHTHGSGCYDSVTTTTKTPYYKNVSLNAVDGGRFANMLYPSKNNAMTYWTLEELKGIANAYNSHYTLIYNADKTNSANKKLSKIKTDNVSRDTLYSVVKGLRTKLSDKQMSITWLEIAGYTTTTTTSTNYDDTSECQHSCPTPSYYDYMANRGTSCYTLTCGHVWHPTHNAWNSPDNPGCWKTAYICGGHCGGHITPLIDIEMDMTYETMMKYSDYKTLYFLAEADFKSIHDIFGFKSLESWYSFWNDRMSEWYEPFPNSIVSFTQWVGDRAKMGYAKLLDFANTAIKTVIKGDKGETSSGSSNTTQTSDKEDVYNFDGWLLADGTPDKGKIKDLESLYGNWETNYEDGKENWEDFDVTFPMGAGAALTDTQKNMVLDAVKKRYPDISQQRIAVITEALDRVGSYYYECTGAAHSNGINNLEGRSECSGFVSGVLSRALGKSIDHFAAEYAGLGQTYSNYPDSVIAGDVGAHANGGKGYTGHVVLVLGQLELPPIEEFNFYYCNKNQEQIFVGGPGYYIIDCTSPQGSCIRKISDPAKYGSIWRGCYD